MLPDRKVPPERLGGHVDPAAFRFETTAELDGPEDPAQVAMVFQPRAAAALELAVNVQGRGFHLYAEGDPALATLDAVAAMLRTEAARRGPADDWVYVHGFRHEDHPRPLRFPPGHAAQFARELEEVMHRLEREIPRTLASAACQRRHLEYAAELRNQYRRVLKSLRDRCRKLGYAVSASATGLEVMPAPRGRPVLKRQFDKLTAARRRAVTLHEDEVVALAERTARGLQELDAEAERRHKRIDREAAAAGIDRQLATLQHRYRDRADIVEFLGALKDDVLEHLDDFREHEHEPANAAAAKPVAPVPEEDPLQRYRVNVLVDNRDQKHAPLVVELNPTYPNLFGRIDRKAAFGALTTDFMHLKPGALHRANGGFLVLHARDLLGQPGAWEALKVCLRTGEIRIQDLATELGINPLEGLAPEPIPLLCRLVLVGEPWLYELLYANDPEFRELFGVRAEFEDSFAAEPANVGAYARVLGALCRQQRLPPMDRDAVARAIELSMRLAGDQRRLSGSWTRMRELLVEAAHWARRDGSEVIRAPHVSRAEEQRLYRASLPSERIRELVERDVLIVRTSGERIGQVNGLAVEEIGDLLFGRPTRISAQVGPGADGVVDIERRAELGGRIHAKALMILQGFLTGRFALDAPLSVEATLTFEQSYGEIDGDSASIAELAALMSALSGQPVRQGIAVTGSVSQDGEAQPVGAVTRKVEAFFEICRARGLDGSHGVILPASNVQHLNLRAEVREAVAAGRFTIWAVHHADEALEILTGVAAGERRRDGTWPEGSLNALAAARLQGMAQAIRRSRREPDEVRRNVFAPAAAETLEPG